MVFVLSLCIPGKAQDGEGPPRSSLDEVVVTATRLEETGLEAPYMIHRVDSDRVLGQQNARTATQALSETAGIAAQKTSHGQGSPFIRGMTGFRTLLLIDGVRLNNSTFRDGPNQYWNTVDPYSLDRIEVVKGPASVIHGSDAIGGTLNGIGRSRPDYLEGTWTDARGIYRYGSAERSQVGRIEAGASRDRSVGLDLGLSWKQFGDFDAGRHVGLMRETGYRELDGDARGEVLLGEDLRVVTLYQHVGQDDVPRTHRTMFAKPWHGTTVGSDRRRTLDQQRDLGYLQVHWDGSGHPVESARASLSFHRQEESRYRIQSDHRSDRQGVTVGTAGFWGNAEIPTSLGHFVVGTDYYHDEVRSFRRSYDATGSLTSVGIQGPVGDDARYDLLGAYVQDELQMADRFRLLAGVRYTHAAARAEEVEDPATGTEISVADQWDHVGGSLRGIYEPMKSVRVFGGASQGFRAPNLSDLTRFDTARSGEIETPSPGLDPERYLSLEVGAKGSGEGVTVQAAYFYTFIDDMIVRFPTGNIVAGDAEVRKANVGDGYIHGVEVEADVGIYEGWSVFGSFAWTEGRVDTFIVPGRKSRRPMDRIPPLQGIGGIRWRNDGDRVWWEGYVRYADEQDQLSPRDEADTERIPPGGTPGYAVYGMRGGVGVTHDFRISLSIENLTNRDYRVHGSGQNEPGTNVILGMEVLL